MNKKKPRGPCWYCGEEVKRPGNVYCDIACCAAHWLEQGWAEQDKREVLLGQPRTIKKYLIDRRGWRCEICGITEWCEQPTPLILDHIDGDSGNNHRSNLRLVCPNCDAQLSTYKGGNRGKGRHYRRERYKAGKSY